MTKPNIAMDMEADAEGKKGTMEGGMAGKGAIFSVLSSQNPTSHLPFRDLSSIPSGAHPTIIAKINACIGVTFLYRLQQDPSIVPATSLHLHPSNISACFFTIFCEKCNPSVVSLFINISLNTVGNLIGGASYVAFRRATSSAFIASTSTCDIVSARSAERSSSTGAVTGRNIIACEIAGVLNDGTRGGGNAMERLGCG